MTERELALTGALKALIKAAGKVRGWGDTKQDQKHFSELIAAFDRAEYVLASGDAR